MQAMQVDLPALPENIFHLLERALAARAPLIDPHHEGAFRVFHGFLEGAPALAVDCYARTLVVHVYSEGPLAVDSVTDFLMERLPWIDTVILKRRAAQNEQERNGLLLRGAAPARKIREHGVWYAIDLTINRDASLYLDTRAVRAWALEHLRGLRVLNTFAYTGSLGVAAAAGGARQVLHLDLNRRFLNLAKDSYALNGLPVRRSDFLPGDFWTQASQLNRSGALFDCVFVDPPFFSSTARGVVDLLGESQRVINKVRPLVGHEGWLLAMNNALFLPGAQYMAALEALCADGYLSVEALLPVPIDFTGVPATRASDPPADPTPFNHPTKIALLRVKRKDGRRASV